MSNATPAATPSGEVVVYEAPADGEVRADARLDRETVWLTQRQMAEVFETSTDNVGLHLENVFSDGELEESATTEDFSVVQTEGTRRVQRNLKHYNLDKRIGSLLFLLYLKQEGVVHGLNSQALTALTLLIAESAPAGKELMIRLIINLLLEPAG